MIGKTAAKWIIRAAFCGPSDRRASDRFIDRVDLSLLEDDRWGESSNSAEIV